MWSPASFHAYEFVSRISETISGFHEKARLFRDFYAKRDCMISLTLRLCCAIEPPSQGVGE